VKFFLYLTDVDDTAGPHIYVKGSHKEDVLLKIRRYTDEEVEGAFGADRIVHFTGPAGTCFLENTYGIHRGLPPASKARLIFQVVYSQSVIIYGPKQPVVARRDLRSSEALDRYVNRVYVCA